MLAPIVLFVYNRPEHTLQTLSALTSCDLASESILYIFADGPKENASEEQLKKIADVRSIIRKSNWCKEVRIIERSENFGLANNVIHAVSSVLESSENIIVLEDDIVVSRGFLRYMNDALEIYKNDATVGGVSGFCYHEESKSKHENFLLPIACSWSWGTWKHVWSLFEKDPKKIAEIIQEQKRINDFNFGNYPFFEMLKDQMEGKVDSWAIRFYGTLFINQLHFVYPRLSLVSNIGFGDLSTHTKSNISLFEKRASDIRIKVKKTTVNQSKELIKLTESSFRSTFSKKKSSISMKNRLKSYIRKVVPEPIDPSPILSRIERAHISNNEKLLLQNGKLLSNAQHTWQISKLSDAEFQVFSQWGDDGIIQYLIKKVNPLPSFIEFGVEDYLESNTRFLLHNNNFKGLIIDGSEKHIKKIKASKEYWMFDLTAVHAFITKDNINNLFVQNNFGGRVGILSIDIDGNDYWIWKAIDSVIADIVIVEYNSVFGPERTVTIPYQADFVRSKAHHSFLYAGTSLAALCQLANEKGYSFIGSNSAGNNAYFVHNDKIASLIPITAADGYVQSQFRESRDVEGNLSYISGDQRLALLKGMPVFNTTTQQIENL